MRGILLGAPIFTDRQLVTGALFGGIQPERLAGQLNTAVNDIALALLVLSSGLTWRKAGALADVPASTAYRAVKLVLTRIVQELDLPEKNARKYVLPMLPEALFLVDGFPVRARGNAKMYNGKYGCKVFKYQAVTDLLGNIVAVVPAGRGYDRRHDAKVFAKRGTGLRELLPGMLIIGDKAYASGSCVVPFKRAKRSGKKIKKLPGQRAAFNKYIQIVRSPIERAFSRLHTWAVISHSRHRREMTDLMVQAVVRLDCYNGLQALTENVLLRADHKEWQDDWTKIRNVIAVREETVKAVVEAYKAKTLTLVGRASRNRKRGTQAVKGAEDFGDLSECSTEATEPDLSESSDAEEASEAEESE